VAVFIFLHLQACLHVAQPQGLGKEMVELRMNQFGFGAARKPPSRRVRVAPESSLHFRGSARRQSPERPPRPEQAPGSGVIEFYRITAQL
jgi:hypothetical protein